MIGVKQNRTTHKAIVTLQYCRHGNTRRHRQHNTSDKSTLYNNYAGELWEKLYGDKTTSRVTLQELNDGCQKLKKLSVAERMEKLQMRPDRADVIVPAAKIFSRVMSAANINTVLAPKLGLVDGLISELAQKYRDSTLTAAAQKG